jgi:hypothetical protein
MKVFIVSLVAAVVLAVGTGFVLEGMFARHSDQTFAMSSVRVGQSGSIEERNFSGDGD